MIDLSSDTATQPTRAMKEAMFNAPLGDEQRFEDPTTRRLEEKAAALLGLDDAVFLPSATMSNQIALQVLGSPGSEVIAAHQAHIISAESGGLAVFASLMAHPIFTPSGIFTTEQARTAIPGFNYPGYSHPSLIVIDNTTNFGGGIPWSKEDLTSMVALAKEYKLNLHMDGSRIFNAHVKTRLPLKSICEGFDTVTLCLSKGLGCPIGALLVFKAEYRTQIQKLKKRMGGSMRQSGILAAAGIYALDHHITRLAEDHTHAEKLAEALSKVPGIELKNPNPATNIILFEWRSSKMTADQFNEFCLNKGFRFSRLTQTFFRAITHLDVSSQDIEHVIQALKTL